MNRTHLVAIILLALLIAGGALLYFQLFNSGGSPGNNTASSTSSSSTSSSGNVTVTLTDSMPLPNVGERFDHMALDIQHQLLFIVARGNNSVYVANLVTEGVDRIITGFNEPQGVAYVQQYHRLYVSNGGDGTVEVLDTSNYSVIKTLRFAPAAADADNMRYDPTNGLLYVGYGEENQSGIGIINTSSDTVLGSIPLNGHPEAFQLEQNGTRIFVNVPTANSIEVVDRVSRTLLASWRVANASENFPMALDEKDHRLFVGVWSSSELFVYDSNTGKQLTSLHMPQDADDLFYDPYFQLILASCGQGELFVIQQQSAASYSPLLTLATGPLARTSLFYPLQEELFVAVPQHDGLAAQLLTFSIR